MHDGGTKMFIQNKLYITDNPSIKDSLIIDHHGVLNIQGNLADFKVTKTKFGADIIDHRDGGFGSKSFGTAEKKLEKLSI